MRRYLPLLAPGAFAIGWAAVLALRPIPAVIDWRIVLVVVVLGSAVMTVQTVALVDPGLREWGLGGGILGAVLAPFGASVTVLALFAYRSGDLGPGWERSATAVPVLAVQALALVLVVAGLMMQRAPRPAAIHRRGRWMVVAGTAAGTAALAVHLMAVAADIG